MKKVNLEEVEKTVYNLTGILKLQEAGFVIPKQMPGEVSEGMLFGREVST
jgi:hypothetical protein